MEEDKKKKKNKKKKNKQNVLRTNDTSMDGLVGDSIPPGNNDATTSTMDLHQDAHVLPEEDTQAVIIAENSERLPLEKDLSLQKEAGLMEKIEELQNEKAARIQQEASLQEQVSQLEKEKDAYLKKEAGLEKIIAELHKEKEFQMQKESLLEVKIGQLLGEKESCSHKEVFFEEKINHLMDETANLNLEKVSLEEKVKQMEKERDSWILRENLSKEAIASLNGDNSSLKSQVVELEELRKSLLQDLQSRILSLERTAVSSDSSTEIRMHTTENGDVSPQTEATHALVEKLIGENSELVEKVNELYAELHNKNLQQETSSTGSFAGVKGSLHPKVGAAEMHRTVAAFDAIDEASEKVMASDLRVQTLKNYENSDENLDANNTARFPDSSEIVGSDEIVRVPLDENERESTDLEGCNDAEKAEVPLTDAPLIGAPFRLISFVARYVSGADLVEKNSGG